MTRPPQVSVVIPCYNRAATVIDTLRSVVTQEIDDFECIVVDDGSRDGEALQGVVASLADPRFVYVRQENAGACSARNRGIALARAALVALLDSDDLYLPHHLGQALAELSSNAAAKLVVYGQVIVDRGGGKRFLKPPRPLRDREDMSEYLLCDRGFLQTSTLVLRTAFAKQVRYAEALPFGQDTDFAIRLAAAGASFRMTARPSVIWRDYADAGRVSGNSRSANRLSWHESVRPMLTPRAVRGDRGWVVAKAAKREGRPLHAARLFLTAALSGCYRPELAAVIALQIFLPPSRFRGLADFYVGLRRRVRGSRP